MLKYFIIETILYNEKMFHENPLALSGQFSFFMNQLCYCIDLFVLISLVDTTFIVCSLHLFLIIIEIIFLMNFYSFNCI